MHEVVTTSGEIKFVFEWCRRHMEWGAWTLDERRLMETLKPLVARNLTGQIKLELSIGQWEEWRKASQAYQRKVAAR